MIHRIRDDRGRELSFPAPPKRVVSLVPSDTYTVAALGCADALVGRTDYCELPKAVVDKIPSIGGTKNPRVADILALQPDLVIANQEENTKKDLEEIAQAGVRVYVGFPRRVADGLRNAAKLARIFGVVKDEKVHALFKEGYEMVRTAESRVRADAKAGIAPMKVFCPIWMKPLMTIHGETFISDMLALAGAQNVFEDRERQYPLAAEIHGAKPIDPAGRDTRYPRVTFEEVVTRKPELVLLPDEPHPFSDDDAAVFAALDIPAAERGAIRKCSGKDLCWYGAYSVGAIDRVRKLLSASMN